jgi:two-component system CheB/CheR fusion protein
MASDEAQFGDLLDHLQRSRGFDFHAYKQVGLERRVQKRLQALSIDNYAEYLDFLEVHPAEFGELFNTIQINVTGFFRDPPAWAFIASEVLPRIVARHPDRAIRVWSCGCASGEEAYTIAMLLVEAIGRKAFRERVKIYATDVDGEALEQARQATYTARQVEDVPEALLAKYFESTPRGYVFEKELRRGVIFGRNDLIQDAPISRLDLLVCRNTLMYFNAEAQSRILSRFHFALNDEGILFLGKAELLLSHSNLFAPLEMKSRIFTKVPVAGRRGDRAFAAIGGDGDGPSADGHGEELRLLAFDASPVGQVTLDGAGAVVQANQAARAMLGVGPRDIGSPVFLSDLASRVPGLRGAIDDARSQKRPATLRGIEWGAASGKPLHMDVHVVALTEAEQAGSIGLFIADATALKRLQDELGSTREELEALTEELESTNEELETTNEELQSANEELETTNEELQSTNEELETMNEELQSTNEELHTVNEEVRLRSEDVQHANLFLESVLASLRTGVAVLDREMRVLAWNRRAEDLWGLHADEARGKHLLNLDIGLPVDVLRPVVNECLAGEADSRELTIAATNRRGRTIDCEVLLTPLGPRDQPPRGVILSMQERPSAS